MPVRSKAMREYRREFLHACRNQLAAGLSLCTEAAAVTATQKTKKWYFDQPDATPDGWAPILDVLIDYQIMLAYFPIDPEKIPPNKFVDLEDHIKHLEEHWRPVMEHA